MKTGEAKRKQQPSNQAAKPSREPQPAVRAQKEVRPVQPQQPRAGATDGSLPIPDLGKYGVTEHDAREHLRLCEPCGRAHKHVIKNPKDVMALDAFGRHIATCLAVQDKPRA